MIQRAVRLAGVKIVVAAFWGFALVWPGRQAAAIPAFARIYGKPCHACHTVFPQLNRAGEALRAQGLHGLAAVKQPVELGNYFAIPGTLPMAVTLGAGEDVTKVDPPGPKESTVSHFDLQFLSILAGGELGPYLTFFADYTPLFTNTLTGDVMTQTRPGLGFLQAHGERAGWLANLRLGLTELPLGTSPRVHSLFGRPYLIYATSAFRMLGRFQRNTFLPTSTQIGGELSVQNPHNGLQAAVGLSEGSNNRLDNNSSQDPYGRVGYERGAYRTGMFLYYSPDILGSNGNDAIFRFGPDLTWFARRGRVTAQLLTGYDNNPTNHQEALWYYGGFLEGSYRWTPTVLTLLRGDAAGMPTFDDRQAGGTTHVQRTLWELTGGAQYLIRENLKVVAELTYSENHDSVNDVTARGLNATLRLVTAFWPFTPPLLSEVGPWKN